MNKKLESLIDANKNQLANMVGNLVVNVSLQAIDDYVADLTPGNPYNPSPEEIEETKQVIRGEKASDGSDASLVADGQIEKQFNIATGTAPEQNFKRGPA